MKTAIAITAALLLTGTASFASARQTTPQETTQPSATTPPTADPQEPASPAQLKREHDRAIAAGDHANDPFNPASSNALNQQQLAKANSLGTGPVYPDGTPASPPETPPTQPAPDTGH